MCVLACAWRAHPRWRLVLAGNRDEYHERPTLKLNRWEGADAMIAGRDLQSGGTWLGVSERGRMAVITNLRGYDNQPDRLSRGVLVSDALAGQPPQGDLLAYNPFNLITVSENSAHFLTNRPQSLSSELEPGLYGLSNGALDEPWPKTMHLKSRLLQWLVAADTAPEHLFDTLREEEIGGAGISPALPSDVPQEPRQSPIFIRNPVYGTRSSTVVAIGETGRGVIMERRFSATGEMTGEDSFDFAWPAD